MNYLRVNTSFYLVEASGFYRIIRKADSCVIEESACIKRILSVWEIYDGNKVY